jgi:glycyl-tRNA synthetase beta subunit
MSRLTSKDNQRHWSRVRQLATTVFTGLAAKISAILATSIHWKKGLSLREIAAASKSAVINSNQQSAESGKVDDFIYENLARAVRARSILLDAKKAHTEKVEEIKTKRQQLLVKATELVEGSPAMDEMHRAIDLLDSEEFEIHRKFKKTLQQTEHEINSVTGAIMERRFGPNWINDSDV